MKNGRNTDGTFSKGNTGRPKGARNLKTVAIENLLEGQAEALTQTAINLKDWTVITSLCGSVWTEFHHLQKIILFHSPYP